MKKLALLIFLFALPSFAQNVRWDAQTTTTQGQGQMLPVLALPNSQVNFFVNCTALPCTTPATTYQSATSSSTCPSNAQVVWQTPAGPGCQSVSDSQGNFGGWFQPGLYQYVVQISGIVAGPYFFTVGGGGGGSSFNGGTISSALFGPNINGEIYPANCESSNPASWCTGSTADAYIRAACTQLPATGGIINLLGLTGTIAASVPCSTPTKQVIMLQDPTSLLTITESDGAITFPLDQYSMFLGPGLGAGQCMNTAGLRLGATANLTAIIGPAHTDGTEESFTASGLCILGKPGATISKGCIYANQNYTNTTINNNNIFACANSGVWLQDVGGQVNVEGNWIDVGAGTPSIFGSGIVITGSVNGSSAVDVGFNTIEHANGGSNYPAIKISGNGTTGSSIGIHVHDGYTERSTNSPYTPDTTAISITDCQSCSVKNYTAEGTTGGTNFIQISQTHAGGSQNIEIDNVLATAWTNIINDTTQSPAVIFPVAANYNLAHYVQNAGYSDAPCPLLSADPGIPYSGQCWTSTSNYRMNTNAPSGVQQGAWLSDLATSLQSVSADQMAGYGSFATGSGTYGTNFSNTGCLSGQGYSCTYTRTNSTAPTGYTYSQQVTINSNADPSIGFNGIQYGPTVSFTAGQAYIASYWGKGDGSFTGTPGFLLWNSTIPVFYCQNKTNIPFTTTWQVYSFFCIPSVSATAYLAAVATTPVGATGTFYIGGFTFSPVTPLSPGNILTSIGPYSVGAATDAQKTITINSTACELGGSCTVSGGGGSGVTSINSVTGAFTFSFSGGAGSCSGTTCTFTGAGTGGGSVTNFIANSGSWPTWLVPSVATSTTTPTLSVSASAIPNSALANSAVTIGSTSVSLGATASSIAGLTLTSPTLTTPALGTPTALVLTNATGTPASIGLANGTGLPWTGITGTPSTSQVPVQSITTTGTSGPATLASGVLNIPQYAVGTTQTICSGTIAMPTAAIASGSAATTVTQTCNGLNSTDNIMLDFNGSPLSTVGFVPSTSGMLTIIKWPTTNTINVSVVNNTGSSITPGTITLNYRVVR